MAEDSLMWGGTTVGDAGPYSDDNFSDYINALLNYDRVYQGVLPSRQTGYTGNLAVTNPAGMNISVATGLAIVDGKLYTNTAAIAMVVVTPGGGITNYYSVVLRKNFAAQTVRAVLVGPSTVTYPTVTQTDGTTWEILLAHISVTDAAVVTVTDQRKYATRPSRARVWIPIDFVYNTTDNTHHTTQLTYGPKFFDTKDCFFFTRWLVPENCAGNIKIYLHANGSGADDVYMQSSFENYRDSILIDTDTNTDVAPFVWGEGLELAPAVAVQPGDLIDINYERDATQLTDTYSADLYVFGVVIYYDAFTCI